MKKQQKYYLIYQIINNLNHKIYIGKHKTDCLDDNYFGSGKYLRNAQEKYGLENFTKTILFYCANEEEMNLLERMVVTSEFCAREDVYNIMEGGDGGWDYVNLNQMNIGFRYANEHGLNNNGDHSLKMDPELHGQHISEGLKKSKLQNPQKFDQHGVKNHMYGKHHSDETKSKMSESSKGPKNGAFGKHWYHDSKGNRKMFLPSEVPDGWFRK